jgi:phosphodiesterase/alkaline phosphatase D-like protein
VQNTFVCPGQYSDVTATSPEGINLDVIGYDLVIPLAAPTASAATNVTKSGFTAHWTSVTGATSYRLDVSTSSTFSSFLTGYQNLDVGNVTSRSVTGLSAGRTYYYRVRAHNTAATSGNSNVISAATVPAAPTASAATNVTTSGFTAHWTSVTGATSYRLDVSTSSTFSSFVTGYHDLGVGNVTSRSVTGLNTKTTYFYRVRARDSGGTSVSSNVISVKTL